MLVLSRKTDESIVIGDSVVVTVVEIRGDRVRLGIAAPRDVTVHRREVYEKLKHPAPPEEKSTGDSPDSLDR